MPHHIIVYGERVRTRDTREECEEIAVKQGWGRVADGVFSLFEGNEIVEADTDPTSQTDAQPNTPDTDNQ